LDNYTVLVDALIKAECDGNPQHEQVLQLGPTPQQLIDRAGFTALPLVVTGKVIGKACFDHGLRISVLKRLPQILAAPKGLFRSANPGHGDSVVVLTFESHAGAPIIVPVRHNQQIGRQQCYNLVTSVYGKGGPDPHAKWSAEGLLIWEAP